MLAPLDGFTVGVTADRRAEEQLSLLQRRGARTLWGPSVRTVALGDEPALADAAASVLDDPPAVVVLLTAVGCRGWMSAAESLGVDHRLRTVLAGARVVVRGPKAAGAALAAGIRVDWLASSETTAEIEARLLEEGVGGLRIAVQRDGAATPHLADAFTAAGADVVDVPVYRWSLPDDPAPAVRLVEAACDGRLDAITFTSSPALENLVGLAREAGLGPALLDGLTGPVVAACVGPVCTATAVRLGITRVTRPERARLGALVQAVVRDVGGRSVTFRLGGVGVVLQGDTAVVGERTVVLSPRERDLLAALARHPGKVLGKDHLLSSLWGTGDPHTVEVTVARLRRRLGPAGRAVRVVPRRGYVLDATA